MTPLLRVTLALTVGLVLIACQPMGQQPGRTEEPARTAVGETEEPEETEAEETEEATQEPEETDDGGGGGGEEVNVFTLSVGDCFDVAESETSTVELVDCEDPHEYEVYEVIEAEGDEHPGDEAFQELAAECRGDAFEAFVGLDYASSRWYSAEAWPSEDEWDEGATAIICALYDPDQPTTTGSAEGTEVGGGDGGDGGAGVGGTAELSVGDCYNVEDAETSDVEAVDCGDEHGYEIYAVLDWEDGDEYPGSEELVTFGFGCWDEPFEDYVDTDYATSRWYSVELVPNEEEWEAGFRSVVCALYDPDERTTTGSAEGSAE